MITLYFDYLRESRSLYKDYGKLRRAVKHINTNTCTQLKEVLFNLMLDEKLLQCDIRLYELEHGVYISVFPYPKRYEKLYDRLLKTIGEGDKI